MSLAKHAESAKEKSFFTKKFFAPFAPFAGFARNKIAKN
jgi:hypothetical protein